MKLDVARISHDNVVGLLEAGLAAIRSGDCAFDLSAVVECDTAAVAMLLAWQREAHGRGEKLQLTGIPRNLCNLADLYGVAELVNGTRAASA